MNNTKDAMYCRLCAELKQRNRLTNLQTDEETCQKVVNMLTRFNIVIDFQENILPKTICLICVKSLERAFAFVTAVEQAQEFLSDFILVQINTVASDSSAEDMLYEPPDNENHIDGCKDEHNGDSMEINDDVTNSSEECDSEVMTEVCNDFDCSVINENTEEHIIIENKHDILPSNEIIEENMNVKDKCVELPDLFHVEDDKNILKEKELQSEGILLDSTACSADCINNQNDSNENKHEPPDNENVVVGCKDQHSQDSMEVNDDGTNLSEKNSIVGTENMDKGLQQLQPQHEEQNSRRIQPKRSATIVHSKTNILNKILETKKIKENNSKSSAKNTVKDLEHVKMTWKEYEWTCYFCETLFPSIEELQQHSKQYHNSCNAYKCADCGSRRSVLKTFLIHVRNHKNDLRYSCHRCFKKFPETYEVGHHVKQVHKNSDYVCSGCYTPFYSNRELKEHVEKYYKQVITRAPFDLTCTICNKNNETANEFRRHLLTHKNRKEYVCETCGKCFFVKSNLAEHMRQHSDVRSFQCEICKSSFKSAKPLRAHIAIHNGEKPFSCDQCGKSFRIKRQLKRHAIIHTDSHPHVCTYCDKSFRNKGLLNQHIRQHTGVKPYSCTVCERDFTNWPNYNKHMKRRHATDMAKKKRTPGGTYPIDPVTREVVVAAEEKIREYKKRMMIKEKK